jgi:hypothetical protein
LAQSLQLKYSVREKVIGRFSSLRAPPSRFGPHGRLPVGPLFCAGAKLIWVCSHPQGFFKPFPNKQKTTGRIIPLGPVHLGKKLIQPNKTTPIFLLISDQQTRNSLCNLLSENDLAPMLMGDQKELLNVLKKTQCATVLIDCGAITINGVGIISKIKVVCKHSHIIIFCDKSHLADNEHREMIKEILAIGVYACIMAPFKGWEVISLVSYYSQLEKKEGPEGLGTKIKKNLL